MKVLQLGAGIQGVATALDLAWNKNMEQITLADYDLSKADEVAELCNRKYGHRIDTMKCDVTDFDALVQYLNGEYTEVEPRSGGMTVQYPEPIGEQYAYHIMHSEIGTVPESYKAKGLKNCTYRIGFPQEVLDKLMFLHGLGFSKQEDIEVQGKKIRPVQALKTLMELQPEDPDAEINDCDIIKTVVKGTKDGKRVQYELSAICRPVREWPELMGAQVYIGGAAAWAAELMRTGVISMKGAFGPEICIPPEPFFEEAAKREIYIRATKTVLLGTDDWESAEKKELIDQGR